MGNKDGERPLKADTIKKRLYIGHKCVRRCI